MLRTTSFNIWQWDLLLSKQQKKNLLRYHRCGFIKKILKIPRTAKMIHLKVLKEVMIQKQLITNIKKRLSSLFSCDMRRQMGHVTTRRICGKWDRGRQLDNIPWHHFLVACKGVSKQIDTCCWRFHDVEKHHHPWLSTWHLMMINTLVKIMACVCIYLSYVALPSYILCSFFIIYESFFAKELQLKI